MKKEKIIKIKTTDLKTLKKLGYNPRKYYVGPWGYMTVLTKFRDIAKQLNIKFPFNPHAFKHDLLYNKGGSLLWKLKVDYRFLRDMLDTIYSNETPSHLRNRWLIRALIFYVIVTLSTPIYIKQGNWKLQ